MGKRWILPIRAQNAPRKQLKVTATSLILSYRPERLPARNRPGSPFEGDGIELVGMLPNHISQHIQHALRFLIRVVIFVPGDK
jgi:hypothetical protein